MATRGLLIFVCLPFAAVAACAAGEQFGDGAAAAGGPDAIECAANDDCWDGDPATEDVCTPAGQCAYLTNVKSDAAKDPEENGTACQAVAGIAADAEIDAEVPDVVVEAVHTAPVELALVYRVDVAAPSRLEVAPAGGPLEGVMFVLLTDCTNACKNRVAWGPELCSPVLAAGTYYLAIFSERARRFTFAATFLEPEESCDGLDVDLDC